MSGGSLDYGYSKIEMIIDQIEEEIANNGVEDGWGYSVEHSKEMLEAMEETIYKLKESSIYAKRLEWYLSGDDGEDSYFRRLREELQELETEYLSKITPKSSDDFNRIWDKYLERRFYGMTIEHPDVLKLVHEQFIKWKDREGFSYAQIKMKFDHPVVYAKAVSAEEIAELENRITDILNKKHEEKEGGEHADMPKPKV